MSWTREQVRMLICEYKKHTCLYAMKTKQYLNKHLRQKAVEEVREALCVEKPEVTINDIKMKFTGLKSTFLVEYKKYKQSLTSGAGDEVYYPYLWYFEEMKYILDHSKPRKSVDSINIQDSQTEYEEVDREGSNMQDDVITITNYNVNNEIGVLQSVEVCTEEFSPATPKASCSRSSSCNSFYANTKHEPKPKNRRVQSEDMVIKAATDTLNKLTSSIITPTCDTDKNLESLGNSENKILATFIASKLSQINNEQIRLETEEEITRFLYETIKQDRLGSE